MDFFAGPDPASTMQNRATKSNETSTVSDPFANVPLNNFEGSDPFGVFTSHTEPVPAVSNQSSSIQGSNGNMKAAYSPETIVPPPKKEFQVKSGIWADSLSRGLIDLNITARKYHFYNQIPKY